MLSYTVSAARAGMVQVALAKEAVLWTRGWYTFPPVRAPVQAPLLTWRWAHGSSPAKASAVRHGRSCIGCASACMRSCAWVLRAAQTW
jgi:hypothetical protein